MLNEHREYNPAPARSRRVGNAPRSDRGGNRRLPEGSAVVAFDSETDELVEANGAFTRLFGKPRNADAFSQQFVGLEHDNQYGVALHVPSGRWFAIGELRSPAYANARGLVCVEVSGAVSTVNARTTERDRLFATATRMSVAEMASTLAHELKQPLATIHNYLQIAVRCVRDLPGSRQAAQTLEACLKADDQVLHASDVISHVRSFIQSNAPQRTRFALQTMAGHVIELLRLDARRAGIGVLLEAPEEPILCRADQVMIEQVLSNLLRNAFEAISSLPQARRQVTVDISRAPFDEALVSVTDQGPGLPMARQQQLFQTFASTKPNGLGIGLAICRSILELHGGRVYYQPNEPCGSVFTFALPTAEAPRV